MICVVYRIGGDTRAEYFLSGMVGAGLLWGCGWLVRAVLSGQHKLWLSTPYDAKPLAPIDEGSGGRGDRRRSKRSVKKIARRPDAAGNAKRHRGR
jgi:hypothetical protein